LRIDSSSSSITSDFGKILTQSARVFTLFFLRERAREKRAQKKIEQKINVYCPNFRFDTTSQSGLRWRVSQAQNYSVSERFEERVIGLYGKYGEQVFNTFS